MLDSPFLVRPGKQLNLDKIPPDFTGPFKSKEDAATATKHNLHRLESLQELLYSTHSQALLIVIQGMDTSGKDGTIEHVFEGINPQGCAVTSFKVPSAEEAAHDFLWRIHAHAPPRGMIALFNRSHYESVLVERVHKLVDTNIWSKRYDHINAFERMLAGEGTTTVKFFLHISKKEQKQRLQARLDDPAKRWKSNPGDWDERKLWSKYRQAYQDALRLCSTPSSPWYVIPADHKWFRNWAVGDIIVRTLETMKLKTKKPGNS